MVIKGTRDDYDYECGFTCGAFDLLHPGHVSMLDFCSDRCGRLIVGLHVDPSIERKCKNKPVMTVYERYKMISSLYQVNQVIPYETEQDLENILSIEPINARFIGMEYYGNILTGESICRTRGIEIVYTPERLHSLSSSSIRKRVATRNESLDVYR
jgi:glycerol-3-phosphate cytidylyltransferase